MKTTNEMVLFWGAKDVYSNWHPSTFFDANGVKFKNTEQYMMWRKAILFNDHEIAAKILKTSNAKLIKDLGRQVAGYKEAVWEKHRLDVMYLGCFLKFSQNPDMKAQLLATGDRIIVEASPYDTVWGIGLGEDDPLALDQKTWRGRNLLGIALMRVRDALCME